MTKLNKDIGMFLYVDYFGFQQSGIGKIASILREKGVYVDRDAAQCVFDPFKRNNEYNITDVEVYSLRKTYPVIGGGILKFNNFNLKFDEDLRVDGEWNLRDISRLFYQHLRFAFPSLFAGLAYLFNRYLRLQLKGKMCSGLIVESQGFSPCYYNYFLNIKKSEIASILQRRRTNYAYLAERLKSRCLQKMCFDALGVEDSPLGLPVRLDCASENCSRLRLKNIEAMQWTTRLPQGLDKKEFKQTFELANATVVLPIQQDLKRKHLDKILEEIGNL